MRRNEHESAKQLLLSLIEAVEDESSVTGRGVAPWYYEQLANVYRKLNDMQAEMEVLERFSRHKHAAGVKPPKLLARLDKIKKGP